MTEPTREERAARYRAFMCVKCGKKRYSAARPRCNECHAEYLRNLVAADA